MQRAKWGFLLFIAALVSSSGLFAQTNLWDTQGNQIAQSSGIEYKGDNCTLTNGNQVVFWIAADTADREVYAQCLGPDGNAVWAQPVQVTFSPGPESRLSCAATSDGGAIVCWQHAVNDYDYAQWVQKIDANGNLLWGTDGNEIAAQGNYLDTYCLSDAQGGMYVLFMVYSNPTDYMTCYRIDTNGTVQWNGESRLLSSDLHDVDLNHGFCTDNAGNLTLIYGDYTDQGYGVRANRVAIDGTYPWGATGINIELNDEQSTSESVFTDSANGGLVAAWALRSEDINQRKIHSCRILDDGSVTNLSIWNPITFSADGQSIRFVRTGANRLVAFWVDNQDIKIANGSDYTVTTLSNATNPGLDLDNDAPLPDGRYLLLWYSEVNGSSHINATQLQANGSVAWTHFNPQLSSNSTYYPFLTIGAVGDHIAMCWAGSTNYAERIDCQLLSTTDGSILLNPADTNFHQGYDFTLQSCQAFLDGSDNLIFTYADCSDGYMLHLQRLDANGVSQYSGLGLGFCPNSRVSSVVRLANGNFAFGYENGTNVYAQLVSPEGTPLWGENGILLSSVANDISVFIWNDNNQLYFLWNEDNSRSTVMKMQKVTDGAIQWEEGGRTVLNRSLYQFNDGLAMWYANSYGTEMRFLHITTDGVPDPQWPASGAVINLEGYNVGIGMETYTALTPAGYLVVLRDRSVNTEVLGQLYRLDGTPLWGENGTTLTAENYLVLDDVITDNTGFTMVTSTYTDHYHFAVYRFDYNGQQVWMNDQISDHAYWDYKLASMGPNATAIIWSESDESYSNPYLQVLRSDGTPFLPASFEIVDVPQQQQVFCAEMLNDRQLLVLWRDYRSGLYYYGREEDEIALGLYAQLIDCSAVSVNDPVQDATRLSLHCYPTPFRTSTHMQYSLPANGKVEISVYNLRGQLVRTLTNEMQSAGTHEVSWDGHNEQGETVASGIYFARLTIGQDRTVARKMVLMK